MLYRHSLTLVLVPHRNLMPERVLRLSLALGRVQRPRLTAGKVCRPRLVPG